MYAHQGVEERGGPIKRATGCDRGPRKTPGGNYKSGTSLPTLEQRPFEAGGDYGLSERTSHRDSHALGHFKGGGLRRWVVA